MTDNEIIKALECCQDKNGYTCDDCPYQEIKHFDEKKGFEIMPNGMTYDTLSCDMWLQEDTFNLINRLQAKLDEAEDTIQFADKELKKAEAENERLRHIATRETSQSMLPAIVRRTKAEAYKEFAEKLHEELRMYGTKDKFNKAVFLNVVDRVKKEMVGEDK